MYRGFVNSFVHRWHRALRGVAVVLMGACTALVSTAVAAEPPGRVGRVAEVEGTLWTADETRGEWAHAMRNAPVTDNDRLSLPAGSRAVVQIGSATLRLDGDTELEVLQLDDRAVRLQLHGGSVALQVPLQDSAREFEIVTAEGRFMPRQRGHYRVDRRQGTSMVTVWDGSLGFESADSRHDVRQGERVDFWLEGSRTHYATAAMDRDGFTDWVVASERRYGRLAQRHVSPEMTGAYDLDHHGSWDTHPQYGSVWYPRSVASDWAPYRYGHWAYVRPWGWTWVDDAPWGFAPFHYGRWVHWHGRWAWVPGAYVARPVYSPALVAWFGGSNVSVGVNFGSAPHVGWVALSPFETFVPWYVAGHLHLAYVNVSPWRHMHGYRNHHHHQHDYANRHVRGAVVVVPQSAVVERRPIRQDVITPAQAQIWRGGRAPAVASNGVAIRVPAPAQTGVQPGTRSADRSELVVPPPPVKTVGVAPPQKPPTGRDVPWVRSGVRGAETGGGVIAQPRPAPGGVAPPVRGEPTRVAEPAAPVRVSPPPAGKPYQGESTPGRVTMPARPAEPRSHDGQPGAPREALPYPRPGEGRQVTVPASPAPAAQPQPRSYPNGRDARDEAPRAPPAAPQVHRAPPPVQPPPPVAVPRPAPVQQVQIQRAPEMHPAPRMQPPPQVRSHDRDDDRGGRMQPRGGSKDERGSMMIK